MYCRHHEVCSSDLTENMLHFLMGSAFSGGKQVPLGGAWCPVVMEKKLIFQLQPRPKSTFSLPSWRPRRCFGLRGARSTVHPTFSLGLSREKGSAPTRYNFRRHWRTFINPWTRLGALLGGHDGKWESRFGRGCSWKINFFPPTFLRNTCHF